MSEKLPSELPDAASAPLGPVAELEGVTFNVEAVGIFMTML
jgi:hypothetical protein